MFGNRVGFGVDEVALLSSKADFSVESGLN